MTTANEDTAAIRTALRQLGFRGSVRHGRGTAYGWIEITPGRDFDDFFPNDRALLVRLGLQPGGNFCVIAPDSRRYWVLKLTDPDNPLIVIEQQRAKEAWQIMEAR